jgi:hypothetical protein
LEAIIHVMEGLIYLFNTDLLKLKKRVCNLERQWLAYRTPMQTSASTLQQLELETSGNHRRFRQTGPGFRDAHGNG